MQLWAPGGVFILEIRFVEDTAAVPSPSLAADLSSATAYLSVASSRPWLTYCGTKSRFSSPLMTSLLGMSLFIRAQNRRKKAKRKISKVRMLKAC
jgi:hypothetical protein